MGPVLAFVGAIFFGTAAGASLGYVIAVNVARLALLSLVSKKLAPKIDLSSVAQDKMLTLKSSIQPQAFVYGQDMLSGPLIYAQVAGGSNDNLHRVIALTGREITSFDEFRIDDTDILVPLQVPATGGTVSEGKFNDVVDIDVRLGTATQTVIAALNTADPTLWTAAHTGRGWSLLYTQMYIVGNNEAFEDGIPTNIRALISGHKVYDPRLDSTQTTIPGAGLHRVNDPATWAWSDNPALCLSDWFIWDQVGMGEEADRIDWDLVAAAADVCEELVDVPDESGTCGGEAQAQQKRYTVNFTFYANQERGQVKQVLEDAMLGRVIFSQGKWRMWAGAAQTPTIDLDESNLAGGIQVDASVSYKDRYNRVRGKFIDPLRNYIASAYPEQISASYVTQDGGQVKYQTFDQNACNNTYECQRNAIKVLRQSRQQIICKFEGNWSCFQVQSGTVVTVTNVELGWSSKKFLVTEWALNKEATGVSLTLVEENDSVWADPACGDYTVRTPTGDLIPPGAPLVKLTSATIHNALDAYPVYAGVKLEASGLVKYSNAANVYSNAAVPAGDWLGAGLDIYSVRATLDAGTLTTGTVGSWLELTTDRFWDVQATTQDEAAIITLEITNDPAAPTPPILATGVFDLAASIIVPPPSGFVTEGIWYLPGQEDTIVDITTGATAGDMLIVYSTGGVGFGAPEQANGWITTNQYGLHRVFRKLADGDSTDHLTTSSFMGAQVASKGFKLAYQGAGTQWDRVAQGTPQSGTLTTLAHLGLSTTGGSGECFEIMLGSRVVSGGDVTPPGAFTPAGVMDDNITLVTQNSGLTAAYYHAITYRTVSTPTETVSGKWAGCSEPTAANTGSQGHRFDYVL